MCVGMQFVGTQIIDHLISIIMKLFCGFIIKNISVFFKSSAIGISRKTIFFSFDIYVSILRNFFLISNLFTTRMMAALCTPQVVSDTENRFTQRFLSANLIRKKARITI